MPDEPQDAEGLEDSRGPEQTSSKKQRVWPQLRFAPDYEPQTPLLKALMLGDKAIESQNAGLGEEAETAAMEAVQVLLSATRPVESPWFDLLARSYALALAIRTDRGDLKGASELATTAIAVCRESVAERELAQRYARWSGFAGTRGLARQLLILGQRYRSAGQVLEAKEATEQAVELQRTFVASEPKSFLHDLVRSLFLLLSDLGALERWADALETAQEVAEFSRQLAQAEGSTHTEYIAASLLNLTICLGRSERYVEALAAAREAAALYGSLPGEYRVHPMNVLGSELTRLGVLLSLTDRKDEELAATQIAVDVYQELVLLDRSVHLSSLAAALERLADASSQVGRIVQARDATVKAIALYRELVACDRQTFLPALARCLQRASLDDGGGWGELKFYGGVVGQLSAPEAYIRETARRFLDLDVVQRSEIRTAAGRAASEAVSLYRELAASGDEGALHSLAWALGKASLELSDAGKRDEALAAAKESTSICRQLAAGHDRSRRAALARSLAFLSEACESKAEALGAAEEAVEIWRILQAEGGDAAGLGEALICWGMQLSTASHSEAACTAIAEGVAALRSSSLTSDLLLTGLEALHEELTFAEKSGEAQRVEGQIREQLLVMQPADVRTWTRQVMLHCAGKGSAHDVSDWLVPLLRQLVERREVAWDTASANLLLELQGLVSVRVWEMLARLPDRERHLVDEAVAALIATLQSPDLARWLDARGTGDGPLARLAELKREIIDAEQLLASLRRGLSGETGAGLGMRLVDQGAEDRRAARLELVERQSAKALSLRQAFRNERARLVAEDPRFAAAFEPLSAETLRSIVGHAAGGALLCVLELGADGRQERTSAEGGRAVAALVHADGRRTQLLELTGVSELAWHADRHVPESGGRRRGPLRGAPASVVRASSPDRVDEGGTPTVTELLAQRMSRSFWAPLQQALQESGVDVERLHVCLHRTTQQLPLALRQEADCAGVQVVPWPGLPYLRRAAMAAAGAGANAAAGKASSPWLVGHDCAWGSAQPLPMVAVEAALLRDLLQRHGQPVQAVVSAAELKGQPLALVACCHGGAEQAQFDHALHLGAEPLTVRQIVQDNIGPPLALLPACHAGRTDEDAAGNALGVAAAFMLSGTKVVSASSKAVPDLLQPWLSTLTVWHAMQGLLHHEAATLAREQFASLTFPAEFRTWLRAALPKALATIQPGGEEHENIRGSYAHAALEVVGECWPWEGDAEQLFDPDRTRREAATRSVADGVLTPRGGEYGARTLAAQTREMAAFVFVYGVA